MHSCFLSRERSSFVFLSLSLCSVSCRRTAGQMFPSLVFVQLEQVRTRDTALIEDQSKARIKASQSDSFHLVNDKVKGNKWHVTICSSSHELLKMIRRCVKQQWHHALKWCWRNECITSELDRERKTSCASFRRISACWTAIHRWLVLLLLLLQVLCLISC